MTAANVFVAHVVLLFSRNDFMYLVWVGRVYRAQADSVAEKHLELLPSSPPKF